ncbi:V-type ATPase 116kDa subunit family protein [Thiorhodococcus minor]|uniref:ATPase n=1 Tax=Thiorhodococcus minor TaxID=57489 RepID=A0A6M0JXF7_9GAMM|nr:V-type ATPase 116kDa subunit family protein [Thiorhodococcus minor]NEV61849.1 ATPase [Thiorhodococcus minor]
MFRPVSTRWLEVLCPREESVRTLTELARTGALELELRAPSEADFPLKHIADKLARFDALYPSYKRYWERGTWRRGVVSEAPSAVAERSLARIESWRREADPLIGVLQSCEEELIRLKWLEQVIGLLKTGALDFAALSRCGPVLGDFCAILPMDAEVEFPAWTLVRQLPWQQQRCIMVLGPRARLGEVARQVKAVKGRLIERPAWLTGDALDSLARIRARRAFLSTRIVHLYAELDTLFDEYDLGHALGEAASLSWFAMHVGGLEPAGKHLLWITGWTLDLKGRDLSAALDRGCTRAILRLTPPPPGKQPPQVLVNPPWMRPFELFAKAFGVPGSDEVDPTPLLVLLVPLLFGYMFGDVGQGAVILAAGLLLRERFPLARLLVLGGASAMVFGVLYGSLFAREDLLPALWMSPLEDPGTILLVPLVTAVALLSLGQMLAGVGARWRGDLRLWLMQDLGFLVLYVGLVLQLATDGLGWLPLLGALWYLGGAFLAHRRLLGGIAAMGHLTESALQILVNTISFARVGAFALAHASLSVAISSMADSAPAWAWLVIMVLGNLVVIALEGLVVSIQTTRLVLFEFFNRFLRGSGRVFQPLPAPPLVTQGAV